MNRKSFLQISCRSCAGLLAIGISSTAFNSCTTLNTYSATEEDNIIRIPLEAFLPEESRKIISVAGWTHNILVILKEGNNPTALLMKCTHIDNRLVAGNRGLTCNLHGSQFTDDGKVITGPATKPLIRYQTRIIENIIEINLNQKLT